MVLERAADKMHPIGEQRRGQRVALDAGIGTAIEAEACGSCLAEAAGAGNAERAAHLETTPVDSLGSLVGFGSPAL
jgi:hypothetical protein